VTRARLRLALPLVLLALAGCGGAGPPATETNAATAGDTHGKPEAERAPDRATRKRRPAARPRSTRAGTVAAALATLPVKGRAPKTGYSREQFGDDWLSAGGCDARERVLARDLTRERHLDDCRIESGTLADPYTAARITYRRGGASEVDIDHVVALADAWQKGAQQWSYARRVAFANDPLNLLAVDASANRQKSDGDAATWLPANKRFRCAYVARQVAVKRKYRAWVTAAERDAIARVIAKCPGQKLPKAGRRLRVAVQPTRGHYYENCDAARAAGAAPLHEGTPDYAVNGHLDRDGDGIACE
jgi:hypothetical protein